VGLEGRSQQKHGGAEGEVGGVKVRQNRRTSVMDEGEKDNGEW
jgi:hypothetical protein